MVKGNSMIDANIIEDGYLLVIDRSIESRNGKITVCMMESLLLKGLKYKNSVCI